jgi:hypothetical protein
VRDLPFVDRCRAGPGLARASPPSRCDDKGQKSPSIRALGPSPSVRVAVSTGSHGDWGECGKDLGAECRHDLLPGGPEPGRYRHRGGDGRTSPRRTIAAIACGRSAYPPARASARMPGLSRLSGPERPGGARRCRPAGRSRVPRRRRPTRKSLHRKASSHDRHVCAGHRPGRNQPPSAWWGRARGDPRPAGARPGPAVTHVTDHPSHGRPAPEPAGRPPAHRAAPRRAGHARSDKTADQ